MEKLHRDEKPRQQVRVHIRWHIARDMPETLEIENLSFDYPWNEKDFRRVKNQRNIIPMAAEHGEKVVGYMFYELHVKKLHILRFAVHPDWRLKGVGAQMMVNLISKLSSFRRTRIALEVRETNLHAQLFFHRQEFRAVRVLRDFYEDSGEAAFLMEYQLGGDGDKSVNRISQYE